MYFLSRELYFPSVTTASPEGIVAVGGDLSPERLLLAYRNGIFPWFEDDEPILWWSPPKRMVLFFEELKISKSMRNIINRGVFRITYNTAFREVIANCRTIQRNGQDGTWITEDMIAAYVKLHEMGYAKSVEVWQEDVLVGGLYGIDLGTVFCGESMFSRVSNASKAAFIALAQKLKEENYRLLDCQVHNAHLESLGAREINREAFLKIITLKNY
ncbi:leucyl/phenylalanyl-tRNA--protein transferase [Flavobacterium salilacus subsp. salilacus]|uniref:leucyl/phenylalanyl-tRNA--protein transferase n=1 Tax=Flavobacterium TaxID=237 RepID=UPI0010750BF5|nr:MULTISPECIES: leucyl/phenylalanyl-tRNA--protein transferase [Flavobacterium]KAF2515778.1 leucyl/phenylalanyl-tRNA--protein transferase [Flavobacterium salilacus subsp. salilacus]MBE1615421.1 leucyl/phenylalanyl-tRNA--protein transferase [Flavobacterium sp. SaA2.13]